MSVFDELEDLLCNKVTETVAGYLTEFTQSLKEAYSVFDHIEQDIERYEKEGVLLFHEPNGTSISNSKEALPQSETNVKRHTRQNLQQEDIVSSIANVVEERVSRSVTNAQMKIERLTAALNKNVKQEMPPPTKRPLRSKRIANNQHHASPVEIKGEVLDNSVIEIPRDPLDVIVLDDSFEISKLVVRVTRAHTKKVIKDQTNDDDESKMENDGKQVKVEKARTKRKKANEGERTESLMNVDEEVSSPEKKRTRGTKINEDSSFNQGEVQSDATFLAGEQQRTTNGKTHAQEEDVYTSPQKKKGRGKKIKSGKQEEVLNDHTFLLNEQQTDDQNTKKRISKINVVETETYTPPLRGTTSNSEDEELNDGQHITDTIDKSNETLRKMANEGERTESLKNVDEEVSSSEKKRTTSKKINKDSNLNQSEVQSDATFLAEEQQTTTNGKTHAQEEEEVYTSPQKKKGRGKKIKRGKKKEVQNDGTFLMNEQQSDDQNAKKRISKRNVEKETPPRGATFKSEGKVGLPNITMVVTNATTIEDLMTDDEDVVPESPPRARTGKIIQVFSPYERSPVKKRVEAFEKMGGTNVTKLKSSTPKQQIPRYLGTPLKHKLRNFSTANDSRTVNGKQDLTLTSGKTASALKASQKEFRERELRRKQKEQEALQKKEAMILSATEVKRRKREEREMKVQQMKALKEKEKQMQLLSAERMKEEKIKQIMVEKEAKQLKLREEAERKRAGALKRAAEAKQQGVAKKLKASNVENQIPVYLVHPLPLLPTADCYDSDEDVSTRATFYIPQFIKKEHLRTSLYQMENIKFVRKLLFSSDLELPNLSEIFPGIQQSKLKRTSSGIWNKTEMSILESMREDEEYEEE